MSDERVAIFIDGSNLYHCLRDQFGKTRFDMEILRDKLCANRKLIRTHYYNAMIAQQIDPVAYQNQQRFFQALANISYFEIHLGRLEPRGNTSVEKDVDVRLAVDMVTGAYRDNYDTAIIVSGDGDFAYAVQAVKDRGKHVENACPRRGLATLLRDTCDVTLYLDDAFMKDVWLP